MDLLHKRKNIFPCNFLNFYTTQGLYISHFKIELCEKYFNFYFISNMLTL